MKLNIFLFGIGVFFHRLKLFYPFYYYYKNFNHHIPYKKIRFSNSIKINYFDNSYSINNKEKLWYIDSDYEKFFKNYLVTFKKVVD